MKKVQKLQKGDTIGVISPSAPLAGMVEHRYKNGIKKLKELGYKIKIGKQALKTIPYTEKRKIELKILWNLFKTKK